MSDSFFVVLGAGQIGGAVTQRLLAAGHRVRQVRRTGRSSTSGALEVCVGDVTNARFAAEVARGARALIHCAVPPYHQWGELLEPLNEGVLHAARTSKAPLLVLDNLYGYGPVRGPMTERTPVAPNSRKGSLRAKVAQRLLDAHAAGDAMVAIARASDFYGPGITLASIFGERFQQRALAGKGGECFGPPDLLHSYSYGPDVAEGLVRLATSSTAWGEVWHLPVAPAESTRAVVARFGDELGTPLGTSVVPGLVLRAMGLFVPAVQALLEMRYQWAADFVLDDTKFRQAFGVSATPLEDGVRATLQWLRVSASTAWPAATAGSRTAPSSQAR